MVHTTANKIKGSSASGKIYRYGNKDIENSVRFSTDEDKGITVIEKRVDGIWQPTSFKTGPTSVWIGPRIGVAAAGHHMVTEDSDGTWHFHTHSDFDAEVSTSDSHVINAYQYTVRDIVVPDDTGEWTGTTYEYNYPSADHRIIQRAYYKTGATAATDVVRLQVWEGTDDTGYVVFDQKYPASKFPANTEIIVDAIGFVEFDTGLNYFVRMSSDSNFSLKGTSDMTYPWTAGDVTLVRLDNLLQTKAWVSGDSWDVDDYFVDSRKLYICNTTGVQTGTFASNSAKWDSVGISHDDYWARTGTVLSPKNAGDDINLNGGDILAPNGTHHITLNNSEFSYNNGTRDRIKVPASGRLDLFSPNGDSYTMLADGSYGIILNQDYRLALWDSTTYMTGPGSNPHRITLNNSNSAIKDGVRDRFIINGTLGQFVSPDGAKAIEVNNAGTVVTGQFQSTGTSSLGGFLHVDATGLVGIGDATSPGTQLYIKGEGKKQLVLFDTTAMAQGVGPRIGFIAHTTSGGSTQEVAEIDVQKTNAISGNESFDMVLGVPGDGDYFPIERLRLSGSGIATLTGDLNVSGVIYGNGSGLTDVPSIYWDRTGTTLQNKSSSNILIFNDGTRDRLTVSSTSSKLISPDGNNSIYSANSTNMLTGNFTGVMPMATFMDCDYFGVTSTSGDRLFAGDDESFITSPDTNNKITLTNTGITLTGDATATTQSANDNSTKLATTAYVDAAVSVEDLWDVTSGTLQNKAGPTAINLVSATTTIKPAAADRMVLSLNGLGMTYKGDVGYQMVMGLAQTTLYSPDQNISIDIANQQITLSDTGNGAGAVSLKYDKDTGFIVYSPNRAKSITLSNSILDNQTTWFNIGDGTRTRFNTTTTQTGMYSPNGVNNVVSTNTGTVIGGATSVCDGFGSNSLIVRPYSEHYSGGSISLIGADKNDADPGPLTYYENYFIDNFWGGMRIFTSGNSTKYIRMQNVSDIAISPNKKLILEIAGNQTIQGDQGFNATDETATLYMGNTNNYLQAIYGTGLKLVADDDFDIVVDDNFTVTRLTQDRIRVNYIETELISPTEEYSIMVRDAYIHLWGTGQKRLELTDANTILRSPDGAKKATLSNGGGFVIDGPLITEDSYVYFGDPDTDGSGRVYMSSGTITFETRASGVWNYVGGFS